MVEQTTFGENCADDMKVDSIDVTWRDEDSSARLLLIPCIFLAQEHFYPSKCF